MTDEELDAWLAMLGRTRQARISTIHDLLRHATTDGMTAEDKEICFRGLRRLGSPYVRMREVTSSHVSPRRFFFGQKTFD